MAAKRNKRRSAGRRAASGGRRSGAGGRSRSAAAAASTPPAPMGMGVFAAGIVLLLVAVVSTLALSLDYLPSFSPPGCGPDGGCAKLRTSALGEVPGLGWPTPFFGFAYFAALLACWLRFARPAPPRLLLHVTRLGALGSLGYLIVMMQEGALCPYCVAVHVANFAFLALLEIATRKQAGRGLPTLATGVGTFAAASLAVGAVLLAEEQAATSATDDFVDRLGGGNDAALVEDAQRSDEPATLPARAEVPEFEMPAPVHGPGREGFTGRYLLGPADAPIRIVTFAGYQCGACKVVEKELLEIVTRYGDEHVSLSMKHYPNDADCNPHIGDRSPHPFGCEAARAAEAVGLLAGPDAYWELSFWLFENVHENARQFRDQTGDGRIDIADFDALLDGKLEEMGMDPRDVRAAMDRADVVDAVAADVAEGRAVGLNQTPMVFINGELFRTWHFPGQLTRAVEGLIERDLPRASAAGDRPLGSTEKLIADWRERPRLDGVEQPNGWFRGAAESTAPTVVVWGCYQSQISRTLDGLVRDELAEHPELRYQFRCFPLHESCNPMANTELSPQGCDMAKAAMVAGMLGGETTFWEMHDWLFEQGDAFDRSALPGRFESLGLDPEAAMTLVDDRQLGQRIITEASGYERLRQNPDPLRKVKGAPAIFIGDRWLQFWQRDDEVFVDDCIDIVLGGG